MAKLILKASPQLSLVEALEKVWSCVENADNSEIQAYNQLRKHFKLKPIALNEEEHHTKL